MATGISAAQIVRLSALYMVLAAGWAVSVSLVLESDNGICCPDPLRDWRGTLSGHPCGFVEYYNMDGIGMSGGTFTVLQFGKVVLTLAHADLLIVVLSLVAATVLFFAIGAFGLARFPVFRKCLHSTVTVRNGIALVVLLAVSGPIFLWVRFAPPREWQSIRTGMSRDEVGRSMPGAILDQRCTAGGDWILKSKCALGLTHVDLMWVIYDSHGKVSTVETASTGMPYEGPFPPDYWTRRPL